MKAVLLLVGLFGTALAVPRNSQRIVGGSATTVSQYPSMANMQFLWWGSTWSQSCGGALLTSVSVLSAAHCYIGDSPNQWRVLLGTSTAQGGGSTHSVSGLTLHPQYNDNTLNNDVCIVRLAVGAVFGANVQPALIAGPNYNLADNTAVWPVGWGALWAGGPSSNQLQHVQVFTVNQNTCVQRYAYLKTLPGFAGWPDVTPAMLCCGLLDVGGRDACQGDSGGPVYHNNNVVVGVVSWGYSCANETWPGVKARVSYFSNWIVQNA